VYFIDLEFYDYPVVFHDRLLGLKQPPTVTSTAPVAKRSFDARILKAFTTTFVCLIQDNLISVALL
jgi:hypothetical protein